jgi:hypothetical protein
MTLASGTFGVIMRKGWRRAEDKRINMFIAESTQVFLMDSWTSKVAVGHSIAYVPIGRISKNPVGSKWEETT